MDTPQGPGPGATANDSDRPQPAQAYKLDEVLTMYRSIREEFLRELQKHDIIQIAIAPSGERSILFQDLLVVRRLHGELQRGASFRAVLRAIKASRAGQLALDFRKDARPGQVVVLNQPPVVVQARASLEGAGIDAEKSGPADPSLAEQYFRLASTLDDGTIENQERAAAAYRKALESDPHLVPAVINLANIHYASDELIEAQALYQHAIGLDPDVFEGHFNLGNIHHDLGRFADAERYYRRALAICPGYPEVHLYLAVVLEKAERPADARIHWQSYRNLAPDGEWAELAREFSETP
jgi:tetratricopeptide (TPR) repeat protein